MATVYSLVCWGGKDGKTATMTIASPCVVSLTKHGLRDGTGVVFSTTGALPTGITAGTTYYARSTATGTFISLHALLVETCQRTTSPERLIERRKSASAPQPDIGKSPAISVVCLIWSGSL